MICVCIYDFGEQLQPTVFNIIDKSGGFLNNLSSDLKNTFRLTRESVQEVVLFSSETAWAPNSQAIQVNN